MANSVLDSLGVAHLARVNQNAIMSKGLHQYVFENATVTRISEATLIKHRKASGIVGRKEISPKSIFVCHKDYVQRVLTVALTVRARQTCTALHAAYRG